MCKVYLEQLAGVKLIDAAQSQLKMLEKSLKSYDFVNALMHLKQLEVSQEHAYEKSQ